MDVLDSHVGFLEDGSKQRKSMARRHGDGGGTPTLSTSRDNFVGVQDLI